MKAVKFIAPIFALGVAFTGVAHAEATMDAAKADETATKVRQVSYSCNKGGAVKVTYGFNKQKLPTYAEAHLGGKTRFLPINLAHSDVAGTSFGDENSWAISGGAMTLGNYHKSDVLIMDPNSEIQYKHCKVVSTKKIKG